MVNEQQLALWRMSDEELGAVARGETTHSARDRNRANVIGARRGVDFLPYAARRAQIYLASLLGAAVVGIAGFVLYPSLWPLWVGVGGAVLLWVTIETVRGEISGSHGAQAMLCTPEVYADVQSKYRAIEPLWKQVVGGATTMAMYLAHTMTPKGIISAYFYYELDGVPVVGALRASSHEIRRKVLVPGFTCRSIRVDGDVDLFDVVEGEDTASFAFERWHRTAGHLLDSVEAKVNKSGDVDALRAMGEAAVVFKLASEELVRLRDGASVEIENFLEQFNALGDPDDESYHDRVQRLRESHHALDPSGQRL